MSAKTRTLHDLVLHQLKDLYFAERHGGKMLHKMAKAARSAAVRQALDKRHDDGVSRVGQLDALFASVDKKAHGVPCEAMRGLIEETKTLIADYEDSPAIDAGLVAAAQAMEHYTIARYAALKSWSAQLGLTAMAAPIEAILAEIQGALTMWAALPVTPQVDVVVPAGPMTLKKAALMGLG